MALLRRSAKNLLLRGHGARNSRLHCRHRFMEKNDWVGSSPDAFFAEMEIGSWLPGVRGLPGRCRAGSEFLLESEWERPHGVTEGGGGECGVC